ncbi:AMP-binding protein [Falsiroseomonas selenitidurans]|uniref:Long-chain fatty acid--CoA ligase n=1 Tax=Falsiroseomonas selenitidurans TaxID=2716335 RepID=A0ABX1E877_9PROT|nr:AMP-binding protein [Falsiroseomonas selenitidurans]NKC32018.1 long-chain fatty acid--CoA ligase [Falsiroseomonas selenitidurans]
MRHWLAAHPPDRPALRFGEAALTYGALHAQAAAMAAALAAQGVARGDRVGFLGQNHPAQIVALFACARLGAMLLPLNWRLAPPEWRFILEDSGARLLLATPEMLSAAQSVHERALDATTLAAPGEAPDDGTPDDPVLLVYTSGTTGRPKGAVLDQRALHANARNALAGFGITEADRVLTLLPLFHVGGLNIQTTPALLAGAEVVLLPRFDPDGFFDAVAQLRPTLTLLVPAIMQALVAHPRWAAADLSGLRAIGAGSSDVPVPLIEAFHARGIPVQQVYGATETCPIAILQSRAEALAAPGSIGHPARHAEARLVDAEGRPATQGEIQIRGPATLRRYWPDRPALDAEGWFATGDVGRIDAEGRWWFSDRLKHVIISGGENIYPAELERLLRGAPGIIEGAIIGRPDPRWGEVPVAVVVPAADFDAARLLAHFEGQVARFKLPRAVLTLPALPRTALGKVEVARLRAMLDQAEARRAHTP